MLGALLGGKIADRFGRRYSLAVGVVIATVGIAVFLTCHLPTEILARRLVFTAAKFVQGTGIGVMLVFSQTYMSETIPAALRAFAMSLLPFFTLLGQLIGAGVIASQSGKDTRTAYLIPLASQFAFTLLPLGTVFILPESPVWLIRKGRKEDALSSLKRIHSTRIDLNLLLLQAEELVQKEQSNEGHPSFRQLFEGTELRRTSIVMIAYASPQFWGLTLLANASYFMQIVGMTELLSLVFLIIGIVVGIVANGISFWTIARFERRILILLGFGTSMIVWTSIGIANCFVSDVAVWYVEPKVIGEKQV
jgi:MFS family permease